MSNEILGLEPKRVWYYFNEICKIPHGPYNEEGIKNYIIGLAKEFGLEYRVDKAGNLVVRKKATANNLTSKPLILQGHLDMVCEKAEGVVHDFKKDPIKPIIAGEWIKADGTTLGADNGIGLAIALTILEETNIKHGPLECLFTVDEEPGLFGALGFDPELIKGRTMINADCEEDGILYIGSAGAYDWKIVTPIAKKPLPAGYSGMTIKISGLRGGHSGLVIHEGRGNALFIMARILYSLKKTDDILLSSVDGGTAYNVIPSLATATVVVRKENLAKLSQSVKNLGAKIKAEFASIDPKFEVDVEETPVSEVLEKGVSDRLLIAMKLIPYGVDKMSVDVKGLVQTSSNFGIVKFEKDCCRITVSSRSSSDSELEADKGRILAIADLLEANIEVGTEYPGWLPDINSNILAIMKKTYKRLFKAEAHVTAIHAGLECGVLGTKAGGMDMISVGPWMENVHSPSERANIESTQKFWKWLVATIEAFAVSKT
ncbi:MAG: hypothetical protein A3I09_04430 [Deltaproteobacteria bacterium RIFCSPLOWO2_02_FULL_47_10]|nr:MAG: hypothetical protein A3I09_04430 [Deltaproteobacteria bacterium RIFCSPLOWO2_02_FULL_47_10]